MAGRVWILDRGADYRGMRWRVIWLDPATRKERSKSFARKVDAEAFRIAHSHALRSPGPYVDPKERERRFEDVAKLWLDQHAPTVRGSSLLAIESVLRTRILPKWGATTIGAIRREHVEQWIKESRDGTAPIEYHSTKKGRGLPTTGPAPRTLRKLLVYFSAILDYAVDHDWISKNPANGVKVATAKARDWDRAERAEVILDFAEVDLLAEAAYEVSGRDQERALIRFLAYSGARIGEALSLKVGDVDLDALRVTIERTWTNEGRYVIGPPKTDAGYRKVPLYDFQVDELKALIRGRNADDWLFPSPTGGAPNPGNWGSRVWEPALKVAEIPEQKKSMLTTHRIRHTAASAAIGAGANVKIVQTMMGHASAAETLDTYGHLWPDSLDEVKGKVSAARERSLTRSEL